MTDMLFPLPGGNAALLTVSSLPDGLAVMVSYLREPTAADSALIDLLLYKAADICDLDESGREYLGGNGDPRIPNDRNAS